MIFPEVVQSCPRGPKLPHFTVSTTHMFSSNMQEQILHFYSRPQVGGGGAMSVFAGSRRSSGSMVGGGFFSTLARFAIPILKNLGGRALRVAARTATDVIDQRRPFGESLRDHTIQEVKSAFPQPH